jgi:hypothetical protein
VLFLDADDTLHPQAVARLLAAVEGSERRLGLMGWRYFGNVPPELSGDWGIGGEHPPGPVDLLSGAISKNLAPCHAWLCPREAADYIGGFCELKSLWGCEDWDFWIRLGLTGFSATRIEFVGAYYRMASGSMSTNIERMLKSRTNVLLRAHEALTAIPELFERHKVELLGAEHRVRRRWMAREFDDGMVRELTERIRELKSRGVTLHRTWQAELAETLLGESSELLTMLYYRWFKPKAYARLINGFG